MSTTNSLHYQLCVEGAKWLRSPAGTEIFSSRNKYVAVELVCQNGEQVDVWGTNGYESTIIEVKTSLHDFYRDSKKYWRSSEAQELGHAAGNRRYYLCPAGLITPDKLPEGWGLLYWTGKYISKEVSSALFTTNNTSDLCYLTSIMRREGIKCQVFNYRGKSKTGWKKSHEKARKCNCNDSSSDLATSTTTGSTGDVAVCGEAHKDSF